MQESEYLNRFNSLISKLAFKQETLWFLDILYKLEVKFVDSGVPTAGVCMKDFRHIMAINKNFIKNLTDDEYTGLILHEILHLALFHNSRIHEDYNQQLWNAACDLEINSIIDTYKIKLPKGALFPKQFELGNRLSSEMYYKELAKNNNQNQQGSGNGQGNSQDNSYSQDQQSQGNDKNDNQYKPLDDHSGWAKNQAEAEMQQKMTEEIINDAVNNNKDTISKDLKDKIDKARKVDSEEQSCMSKKKRGNGSSGCVRHIISNGDGKIQWNYLLNKLIRRTLSKSFLPSFKRTNRRYGELVKGHIKNHEIDNIIIAVDTSGSIDERLHQRFMEEIKLIQRMFKIKIRYIQCDSRIQSNFEFTRSTNIDNIEIKGGGGTDFIPVFDLIEKKHYNPNAILYFTDGQGYYPKISKYNTLWILSDEECLKDKDTTPPFGTIITLNK